MRYTKKKCWLDNNSCCDISESCEISDDCTPSNPSYHSNNCESSSQSNISEINSNCEEDQSHGNCNNNCDFNVFETSNKMSHICDHIKKAIEVLKKIIDNIAMVLTIICLTDCQGSTIQIILCEILELYDCLLGELRCGINSLVLPAYVPIFEKYKRIVTKIKACKYDKIKSGELLVKINKNQCQILKVLMIHQNTLIKRYLSDLECNRN